MINRIDEIANCLMAGVRFLPVNIEIPSIKDSSVDGFEQAKREAILQNHEVSLNKKLMS